MPKEKSRKKKGIKLIVPSRMGKCFFSSVFIQDIFKNTHTQNKTVNYIETLE